LISYLRDSGRDLEDVYRASDKGWVNLLDVAGLYPSAITDADRSLLRRATKFLHVDDTTRIDAIAAILDGTFPSWAEASVFDRKIMSLVFWNLFNDGMDPKTGASWKSIDEAFASLRVSKPFVFEVSQLLAVLKSKISQVGETFPLASGPSPLKAHATYTRYELLGALGYGRLPGSSVYEDGRSRTISGAREGVYFVEEASVDLFLITLQKSASLSPSIRYHDYAISKSLFHWESQSRTTPESPTGQRYINHEALGGDVLLAVRASATDESGTQHFKLLGPARYVRHEGTKPIKIWWELKIPMDTDSFDTAAAAKVS
ncbi:MAG: hypothetical protein RLZZ590_288, partial [Actinomycetota bacterium]